MKTKILYLDKDDHFRKETIQYIEKENFEVIGFGSLENLLSAPPIKADIILVDFNFGPGLNPIKQLEKLLGLHPLPCLVYSNSKEVKSVVRIMRKGVFNFLVKRENGKEVLIDSLKVIAKNSRLKNDIKQLQNDLQNSRFQVVSAFLLLMGLVFLGLIL